MSKVFKCHKISEGAPRPRPSSLSTTSFYLMDPKTGVVIEPAHDLKDKERRQKILIFPGGKGTRSCRPTGCSSST